MNNHHRNVFNRTCLKKDQRGREVFNISNYSYQKTLVPRLVDLLGREEHWTLHSLNLVIVQGIVYENCEVLVCWNRDLNFHPQHVWLPIAEA